jgi:hypothetical protein
LKLPIARAKIGRARFWPLKTNPRLRELATRMKRGGSVRRRAADLQNPKSRTQGAHLDARADPAGGP